MSKLLEGISDDLKEAGESLDNEYTSLMYGSVVKMLNRIQGEALELEAEKDAYKTLLEAVVKYSSAEDVIKKQCQDALDRFEK
jgi:hypothetical protein